MKFNPERLPQLERLVDELIKTQPSQTQIQAFMRQAGLSYSPDPLEQLNTVLSLLQASRSQSKNKKVRDHEPNL